MTRSAIRRASAITSAFALTAFVALATATPASAETLPPAYYPVGPQLGVPADALDGWELCYSGYYEDDEVDLYGPGGIIDELCTGEYLLLAGSPVDSVEFTLLAAAPRADVLFDTGVDLTTTHVANGTAWYFNPSYSWGFALPGTGVEKDSCDVLDEEGEPNGDFRLCFHADGDQLDGGYRLGGITDLNGSDEYLRFVFQSDGIPVAPPAPQLAATGHDAGAPLLIAGGLFLAGIAGLAATTLRRRSA